MAMNKKRKTRTILLVIAIVIVLALLTFFVIKGVASSTGKVITNNGILNNVIKDSITIPPRAVENSPNFIPEVP